MEEYTKAIEFSKESLKITQINLGKKHLDYSICLNKLANLYKINDQ